MIFAHISERILSNEELKRKDRILGIIERFGSSMNSFAVRGDFDLDISVTAGPQSIEDILQSIDDCLRKRGGFSIPQALFSSYGVSKIGYYGRALVAEAKTLLRTYEC